MKPTAIRDWLGKEQEVVNGQRYGDLADTAKSYQYLLGALRSRAPGQSSQNLLELSRHFTSASYLAINTLANQAANSEVKVFEWTPDPNDGDIELSLTDPLWRLLRHPNNDDSLSDLLYQIVQQLSLTGISMVWMPPNKIGIPGELYVIPSASAVPSPPSPMYPHGSYLVNVYAAYGPFATIPSYQHSAGARIPAEQILRVKNHHPYLRYDGWAVLTACSRQIDTVEAIDLARHNAQQKGIDPSLSMEFDPAILDPSQTDMSRLREQLEALYAGPLGKGRLMLNPIGSKVTKISNTPSEMDWQQGWSQLVDFTLAAYGVPKSCAGLQDDVNYATLYSSLKQFTIFSLNPLLKRISDKITKHLIEPFFGDDLYIKMEGQKITDEEVLEKQLHTDSMIGIRTKNEWRQVRGLQPFKGPEGEELVYGGKQKNPDPIANHHPEDDERPENLGSEGSLPIKRFNPERLAIAFEHAKSKGVI